MTDAVEIDGDFLERIGLDAAKWASEFCKRWPFALCQIPGKEGVDGGADFEATMLGWFANAIELARSENTLALAAALDEVARLREALVQVDALDPEGMVSGCSESALRGLVNRMGNIARAALAAFRGATDGEVG